MLRVKYTRNTRINNYIFENQVRVPVLLLAPNLAQHQQQARARRKHHCGGPAAIAPQLAGPCQQGGGRATAHPALPIPG